MTAQVNFVPEGIYTNKDLERLSMEINRLPERREVMRADDVAKMFQCSVRKVNELCQHDKIPFHRVEGLDGRLFLRSELIEFIKKS